MTTGLATGDVCDDDAAAMDIAVAYMYTTHDVMAAPPVCADKSCFAWQLELELDLELELELELELVLELELGLEM